MHRIIVGEIMRFFFGQLWTTTQESENVDI